MSHRSKIVNRTDVMPAPPVIEVKGYGIFQWHPTPDGSGPPTAVVLQMDIEGLPIPLGLRFKSRAAADEFTLAFQYHVNGVWPIEKGKQDG